MSHNALANLLRFSGRPIFQDKILNRTFNALIKAGKRLLTKNSGANLIVRRNKRLLGLDIAKAGKDGDYKQDYNYCYAAIHYNNFTTPLPKKP